MAVSGKDLFQLVRHLDKAERDRVSQMAKMHKENSAYLELFKCLCELGEYTTDKDFLDRYPKAKFKKSFPKLREYLLEVILDALRSHRQRAGEEKTAEFRIREMIEEIHLLRSRQLYDLAYEKLLEAKELAENHEFLELLLEILRLERTHLGDVGDPRQAGRKAATLRAIGKVGRLIHLNCRLLVIRDELFAKVRSDAEPDPQLQLYLKRRRQSLDRIPALKCTSTEAKTNYHLSLALLELKAGDRRQAWEHHHAVYKLWCDKPDFAQVRNVQRIKLLNNFLTTSITAGITTDFIAALSLLEGQPRNSPEEEAEAKQNFAYIRLQYFLSRAQWDDALKIEDAFNQKPAWATTKSKRPRILVFYLSFARLHFVLGNFSSAKRCLRKFDSERENSKVRDDKAAEAKMLELLMGFEDWMNCKQPSHPQGDIVNAIRSAQYTVSKTNNSPPYLRKLLNGLKRISNLPQPASPSEWKRLEKKVHAAVGDTQYDSASQLFLAWLKAKHTNIMTRQVLEQDFPTFPKQEGVDKP